MSLMTSAVVTSMSATERSIRQRWDNRGVQERILTSDDPGAPRYVIHCGPPTMTGGTEAGCWPVIVDVIARFRGMCDATVRLVAPLDDGTAHGTQAQGARLGCLPANEHYDIGDPAYVDSVRWALAQLWDADLLYEAPHRLSWCATCAGAVDDDGVHDVQITATSATVRFPVGGDCALQHAGASLLVDVDAPWTVPATTAVRIDPDSAYVLAQAAGDDYPVVVARTAAAHVLGADVTIHREVPVAELLRARFLPPSAPSDPPTAAVDAPIIAVARHPMTARTSLAPVTPACSVDDWRIAADHELPIVDIIGVDGRLTDAAGRYAGSGIGDADRVVVADLDERGLVVSVGERPTTTASCLRCRHPVVHRAHPAWMVATAQLRDRLQAERAAVGGRSTHTSPSWAAGDDDWPVARPGVGGIGIPAWSTDRPQHHMSYVVEPTLVAAAMPFARFGFPGEPGSDTDVAHRTNANLAIDAGAPAGRWIDAVTTLSVLLWDAACHDTALCVAHEPVVADDALADPTLATLIDRHGVDAVRVAALTEPDMWRSTARRPLLAAAAASTLHDLRDACDQLVATADRCRWAPSDATGSPDIDARHVLDRWILAELADTVTVVGHRLEEHDTAEAGRRLRRFVDDVTTWYLPQRRPGDAGRSDPGNTAITTAHECLVTVAALLAPFAPMTSEAVYEALVRAGEPAAPDSVHLLRYPTADPAARNDAVRDAMAMARRVVALGHRARRDANIAANELLPRAVVTATAGIAAYWDALTPTLAAALSVKRIVATAPTDRMPDGVTPGEGWHTARDGEIVVAVAAPAAHPDRPAPGPTGAAAVPTSVVMTG